MARLSYIQGCAGARVHVQRLVLHYRYGVVGKALVVDLKARVKQLYFGSDGLSLIRDQFCVCWVVLLTNNFIQIFCCDLSYLQNALKNDFELSVSKADTDSPVYHWVVFLSLLSHFCQYLVNGLKAHYLELIRIRLYQNNFVEFFAKNNFCECKLNRIVKLLT